MRIYAQALVLLALVLLLWFLPNVQPRTEAAQVPYRHLFAVLALGGALIACLAPCLVHVPFRSMKPPERAQVRKALRVTELFPDSRHDPQLSPRRIFGGWVIGVLSQPLQFLLLPSFAVILVPEEFVRGALVAGLLASSMLITAANLTSRWNQMTQYLRRYFLLGTPLVVSGSVIVIAALRLWGVQYVTTVLNVAPFGVLFAWMVFAYVFGWWFEYQVNSVLAAKLLWVFGADGVRDDELVAYRPGVFTNKPATRVELQHRYIAAHATGQFVVRGQMVENETKKLIAAFETYAYVELFDALLARSDADAAHEIGRRVQLYFALVNVLLVVGVGLLFWHVGRADRLNIAAPVVTAHWQPSDSRPEAGYANLAELLTPGDGKTDSAIVVAASGGGTRAAMYTASVMQGLHRLGADRRVVLLSGVSGGGVAAAYFYSHRAALLSGKKRQCERVDTKPYDPWECYVNRMAMPFIGDVLGGATEWRLQGSEPLGVLLAESFERRLFAGEASGTQEQRGQGDVESLQRLGANTGVGLILNTTITGHPLEAASAIDYGVVRLPDPVDRSCQQHERAVSVLAGGRLAFSNLRDVRAFDKADAEIPSIRMPFVVVRDPTVGLAQAAALNANFPPVFPNARVDLTGYGGECDVRSYYVTDGGATENLGLLSALLALESALNDRKGQPVRDIDIVLAEASAIDIDYEQDRGVGAATGQSKERLTGRLTVEVLEHLREVVKPAKIRVHDLSLPRVFRSRGGFGTHWMFPRHVEVNEPLEVPMPALWMREVGHYSDVDPYWVTLNKKELMELWNALYEPDRPFCKRTWAGKSGEALTTVSRWICGVGADGTAIAAADSQPGRWADTIGDLRER